MLGLFYTLCYYVTMAGIRLPPEDSDVSSARPLTTTDMVSDDDRSVAANSWSIKSNYGSTLDDDQRHADASEALSAVLYPAASDYSRYWKESWHTNVKHCAHSSDKEPDAEPVGSMLGFQSYWDVAYADELANFRQYGHMTANLLVCIILLLISGVKSYEIFHKIHTLPGQPEVMFNQFSGYVDVEQSRKLFYYFVEAQSKPASRPLVLWLNGGPGCSSIGSGAFVEHGPFKLKGNALVKNEYSWNKEANMLYLESPAGVGFSYSTNTNFYDHVDDEMTAQDNLIFLERWLDMFPTFKGMDFFIAGESYGGHYVPQLAQLILKSDVPINLKGVAVGNPLLEFNTDYNSRGEYFWSRGLISDATYMLFQTTCNFSTFERQSLNRAVTPKCKGVMDQAISDRGDMINLFDVSVDVCMNDPETDYEIAACIEWFTIGYLNRRDVQKALHARLVGVDSWLLCSQLLHYDVQSIQAPTIDLLGTLVKSGIRVLIFSGDQGSFLPLTGTRKLIDGLAKKLNMDTTVPYSPWVQGHKVGGWTQTYGDILTFATIRGAGNEAGVSQPERSLTLFKAVVTGKSLPKPLAHQ